MAGNKPSRNFYKTFNDLIEFNIDHSGFLNDQMGEYLPGKFVSGDSERAQNIRDLQRALYVFPDVLDAIFSILDIKSGLTSFAGKVVDDDLVDGIGPDLLVKGAEFIVADLGRYMAEEGSIIPLWEEIGSPDYIYSRLMHHLGPVITLFRQSDDFEGLAGENAWRGNPFSATYYAAMSNLTRTVAGLGALSFPLNVAAQDEMSLGESRRKSHTFLDDFESFFAHMFRIAGEYHATDPTSDAFILDILRDISDNAGQSHIDQGKYQHDAQKKLGEVGARASQAAGESAIDEGRYQYGEPIKLGEILQYMSDLAGEEEIKRWQALTDTLEAMKRESGNIDIRLSVDPSYFYPPASPVEEKTTQSKNIQNSVNIRQPHVGRNTDVMQLTNTGERSVRQ